ncbi:putative leucine-rich repeat domain superfamily, F-box-like domain superfamily [Helianthus annuus]|uniref:Leucine-rich repeat domain superfamily, F-box-like domain superfamily n=1 Tax=Helianthus annuus TaxID=4232 RepID=A0A251V3F1_HELAN|nr:F-box/LRR-repeat protein At4g29420 [Helianthus annuus]KAF5812578.1 putative leucine-rich repeat domain superfamily, F-box-like domain superfamily [Helianthus annuus]KAJ0606404.1 putative F-box protein AUF1 [Helianthus annuus]KAJ0933701.1 putative leucine-rich repeat domain superfamily, F-box-like domain superfamily [Helianthus annuus]
MDKLPESLLLEILSRLDNSADVACCRVASKAFNNVFPDLRSINLLCSCPWCGTSGSVSPSCFKKVFLDLISKLRVVESVCIGLHDAIGVDPVDEEFLKEWLPRVSQTLKSLSLFRLPLNVLPLISKYCHNLVELNLGYGWLSVYNLNPMPMLTTLTLAHSSLEDQHLNQFNKCFPNLQVLKLVGIIGLKDPKFHHLNLQTCHWSVYHKQPSLTLITPNLITLRIECFCYTAIHVEAPMLSHFHLSLDTLKHAGFLLSEFPTTKTVETLILDSRSKAPRDARYSKFTLEKVFRVFPNVSFLRINSGAWSELEACLNPEGWEILDGSKGLKTICAYLMLVDPLLTFSYVARLLDQCVGLSLVSLLIHCCVDGTQCKSFRSKCMAHWPGLKWRWGIWGEGMKDTWITDLQITEHPKSSKKLRL